MLRDRLAGSRAGSLPWLLRRHSAPARGREDHPVAGRQDIPFLVCEDIIRSVRYRSGVGELADRLRLPRDEVDRGARAYLREMVAGQNRIAIDSWGRFGAYVSRAYRIDIARARLGELRRLGQHHPLVFLPSHRSYLDPLVLRPALLRNRFAPNYVLSGINLSFWPLGPLARRSGYVFIRRGFAGDEIYKWVLRQYLGHLLLNGCNLEWYVEGGRSRTGKLRPPRYGMLTYLTEAFCDRGVDDIYIVPVSITYDQLYEVGAMEEEARGGTKRPESLSWVVQYIRAQGRQRGQVHLAFGEPLSLAGEVGRHWATLPPVQRRRAIQKLGIAVMRRIDSVTPVTAMGLVTLCLLGIDGRALTVAEIKAELGPLLDYVRRRNLPSVAELPLGDAGGIERVLEVLISSGVITCYGEGTHPVYQVAENQDLVAAFYRNNIIHFLVNRAVAELVLQAAAEEHYRDPVAVGWQEALRLRELLKFEFFFSDKRIFRNEMRSELSLIDEQWPELLRSPYAAAELLERVSPHLAHRVLTSFLEAYLVVAERLAARPSHEPVEERPFLAECLGVGRQLLLQQRITSSESLSVELFSTGLQLARHRGLADPGGKQVADRRAAFVRELETLVGRVHRSRALALRDIGAATSSPPASGGRP
ncbi:glycerol-3-phosphate 1-O-acyltransferase [Streptomyces sp. RB6PN25]|uniref:Glycerol-3-phosphate 1-O-acyltransferase n=2 Tax=Streptomyces humicola TaxID=2953240 RepID=A0ABT1Q1R6_9ACTN|nr:glycerol-3-phosphate 1-O-acyltransferase [Streptomyces humicola]